jgi:tRNA pseudouridine38-40 synthase
VLNLEQIHEAALFFKGTHDFSSFCSTHSDTPNYIRNIMDIRIEAGSDGLIRITMEADGFLRHMVRGIVGTLVEVGRGNRCLSDVQGAMNAKDRRYGGMTAPPGGLFLKELKY